MYLNFNPLVTNRVNGGSGYQCSVKCVVTGNKTYSTTTTVLLINPYRPITARNSGGVGYQCYEHSSVAIPASVYEGASKLTVTVSYPFPSSRHVALSKDSLAIGYDK